MEERASVDCAGAGSGERNEGEEEKKQKAMARVSVCSMSLLLAGLMAFMACSHRASPLWLVSELCSVICILLYFWAYHLTQNITASAVVPVDALVFAFPLVFGAGFLAALLAVTVAPVAGALVMVADVACMSGFFGFCRAEYKRYKYNTSLANEQESLCTRERSIHIRVCIIFVGNIFTVVKIT
ncbi:hypothetical protein EJB05_17876, partial [Eragrostis curvula]